MRRSSTLLSTIVLLLCLTGSAHGAAGDLTQKAGSGGCLQNAGLPPCATGHALDGNAVVGIAASPDGLNAYATFGFPSQSIAVFDRDGTGGLSQDPGTSGCVSNTGSGGCVDGNQITGLAGVAVTPDGKSLYAAGIDSSQPVVAFTRNSAGDIVQKAGTQGCFNEAAASGCGDGRGIPLPNTVVPSPDNRFLFVSGRGGAGQNGIAVFQRNTTTLDLGQAAGAAACVRPLGADGCTVANAEPDLDSGVDDMAISPDGQFLYALFDSAVQRFSINQTTGALTETSGTSACVSSNGNGGNCAVNARLTTLSALAVSPDGRQLYVGTGSDRRVIAFDRDVSTGVLTTKPGLQGCLSPVDAGCTTLPVGAVFSDLDIAADGRNVYATSTGDDRIVALDRDSAGVLTPRPVPAGCNDFAGLLCSPVAAFDAPGASAISPDGANVYSPTFTSESVVALDRELPKASPTPPPIDKAAPVITLKAARRQRLRKLSVAITVNEPAKVRLTSSISVSARSKSKRSRASAAKTKPIKLKALSADLATGRAKTLKPRLAKSRARSLARKLKRGQKATLTFTVKATDAAGNSSQKTLRVKLRR